MGFATVVQRRGQHMDDSEKKLASRRALRDKLKMIQAMQEASPLRNLLSSPAYQRLSAQIDLVRKLDPLSDDYDPVPSSSQPSSTAGVAEKLPAPTKAAQAQSTQDAGHALHVPGQRWTDEQRRQLLSEIESHPKFGEYRNRKAPVIDAAVRLGCSESLIRQQLAIAREARKKSGADG